ncbi:MAG: GNAT family N-acetyltransferase [SAR202 cluster bacterium]|nr:GNAT family N-acetyltransferase [SAR202 cluster bacterium]
MVAEYEKTQPPGAAGFSLFYTDNPGYGFIDESIPEVSIAVLGSFRCRGIGTELLSTLLEKAADAGFQALSLSVSKDNPALQLYEKLEFAKVKSAEWSWTMSHRIRDSN